MTTTMHAPRTYRLGAVEVEAMRLDPGTDNWKDVCDWIHADAVHTHSEVSPGAHEGAVTIVRPEGTIRADPGWWIIHGPAGDWQVCAPALFKVTYGEPAFPTSEEPLDLDRTEAFMASGGSDLGDGYFEHNIVIANVEIAQPDPDAPVLTVLSDADRTVVRIYPDGRVEYDDPPTEAAAVFWEALKAIATHHGLGFDVPIAQRLVSEGCPVDVSWDDEGVVDGRCCSYCGADADNMIAEADIAHKPDCLWLSVRAGAAVPVDGALRIAIERSAQAAKGFGADHDDEHQGDLVQAAVAYATVAWTQVDPHCGWSVKQRDDLILDDGLMNWPWDENEYKPSDDPIRNLERAGALIAAEIDRLVRAGASA